MTDPDLTPYLSALLLADFRYLSKVDSTNEEALRWIAAGAPHLSLVVADGQTAGRGRLDRHWFTPPGYALAFSLILRPAPAVVSPGVASNPLSLSLSPEQMPRLTALAALGVCQALQAGWSLQAGIKWPNDVLIEGRKVAGILVETSWQGEQLSAVIVGVGVNVTPASVPPPQDLLFPATCVEAHLTDLTIDRWELLARILSAMLDWIPRLPFPDFIHAWQYRLAYLGKQVQVYSEASEPLTGHILGLTQDGSLRLLLASGQVETLQFGEVHLRLVDNP